MTAGPENRLWSDFSLAEASPKFTRRSESSSLVNRSTKYQNGPSLPCVSQMRHKMPQFGPSEFISRGCMWRHDLKIGCGRTFRLLKPPLNLQDDLNRPPWWTAVRNIRTARPYPALAKCATKCPNLDLQNLFRGAACDGRTWKSVVVGLFACWSLP